MKWKSQGEPLQELVECYFSFYLPILWNKLIFFTKLACLRYFIICNEKWIHALVLMYPSYISLSIYLSIYLYLILVVSLLLEPCTLLHWYVNDFSMCHQRWQKLFFSLTLESFKQPNILIIKGSWPSDFDRIPILQWCLTESKNSTLTFWS
jgi:hypothetical protein